MHSVLHLLLFLFVGVSFVCAFPLPGGILVFPASTQSFFLLGLLWAMGVRAEHSLISTLPGSCGLSSLRDEVQTLQFTGHPPPGGSCSLSSLLDEVRTVPRRVAGCRGDWSCCCRGIPQSAPEGLFLFGKNPPAQSCGSHHTRKGLTSHTAHLFS